MAKYRKRPVIVEAQQWLGPESSPMPGVYVDGDTNHLRNYYCITIHGQRTPIAPGDWIILERQQFSPTLTMAYPCKPDVFAATYEPVAE